MIVVDEYLAIRSIFGDVPDSLPDDALAITASTHWRILQRLHLPGEGQLSQVLAGLSDAGRRALRRPGPETLEVIDPRPLLDQAAEIQQLDRLIRSAPADTTHIIDETTQTRDALLARQRVLAEHPTEPPPSALQRRIDHLDRRITIALTQQDSRQRWIEDHAELLEQHQVVVGAERAVEMRIRQHPLAHLPAATVSALGPEPKLQRERAAWVGAASAAAIHHHRHGIEPSTLEDPEGPAAVLGERPNQPDAAASWDYAALKLVDAGLEPALESGAEL